MLEVPLKQLVEDLVPAAPSQPILLNSKRRYLQVTILGTGTGTVTFKLRPELEAVDGGDKFKFKPEEYEDVVGLSIDLSDATNQRTFTISDRLNSALIIVRSAGTGTVRAHIRQTNS